MREPQAAQELRELPVDVIEPNLSQPRRYFDGEALDALADSLRERGARGSANWTANFDSLIRYRRQAERAVSPSAQPDMLRT
jgi:hypothetical protein